ncbi:MAG: nickel pincer cofactor biosynthesis protein LarC [Cenarchaeum sp. SB0678_bin_8]|nr:nickel pincer cofactor biosynthesis protein LarC [Cenarchaeum sp. SB0666_bin_15]MYD58471.1 nickel pincer cofactor biosynthesis protein LarC [Cenarchaeum sp. SB0678_bin_8]MYJ27320.1 nickel pincer cofactor biosynthesis protein LarC [Cenarchaeum sp. SB0672_bin_9]
MVLVIDPRQAGISGDMMLSALVDMRGGGDAICKKIKNCTRYLDGSSIRSISFQRTRRSGMACTQLRLDAEDPHQRLASEIVSAIEKSVTYMELSSEARLFAKRTVDILISVESQLHSTNPDSTRLHELSSVDTLVDIVGVAMALDAIGAFQHGTIMLPVNVGSGTVEFAHGRMHNPAPATLSILSKSQIPIFGSDTGMEMTTPTGAAIMAGLGGNTMPFYPHMTPKYKGYGAGSRDTEDFPNTLLLVQGDDVKQESYDIIYIVETNVDDVSGEVIGGVIPMLLDNGALDATVHVRMGKKGRPVHVISVMCSQTILNRVVDLLIHHTGTLGVRLTTTHRYRVRRRKDTITVSIKQAEYKFRYKTHNHKHASDFKIEFDDIAHAADATGMNPHQIERLVRRQIEENE